MLKVFVTVLAALLLFSCSSTTGVTDADRETSKSYYRFRITESNPTSSQVYYVWPENQIWGNYSVYRVIEPIVDIDSYEEIIIDGLGPDGQGRYRMRVVIDQEQIEEYTWVYFLVAGS